MRIYAFTEHFPNLYKPYLDAQFADLLAQGHELRIFAFGKFEGPLPARTARFRLKERTSYLPLTLRSLPRAVAGLFRRPMGGCRSFAVWDGTRDAKRNVLDAVRAALLPRETPDLCLIHNLVSAQYLGFLGRIYAGSRIALYFHGGEVPQAGTIDAAETTRAFESVDRVFTNTAYSRELAIGRGCPPAKIAVCPLGFWLDDYDAGSVRRYRRDGVLRLLSAGRVSPEKGLDVALDAARILLGRGYRGRFSYRIVGRGPALGALEAALRDEELAAHVELRGELPNDALLSEYRDADVLLLPSVRTPSWEENQACVAQEAMLMGLPVLATRTGGVLESIAPELHALSMEPGDAATLADRIERLLTADDRTLARLGAAARAFTVRRYEIGTLDRRLLAEALTARGADRRKAEVGAATVATIR